MMRRFVVMQPQQIHAKIIGDVPPDGVDVVRVVLRVIVFHKEKRAVEAVVVRHSARLAACPREVDIVDASLAQFAMLNRGYLVRKPVNVFMHQLHQHLALMRLHGFRG